MTVARSVRSRGMAMIALCILILSLLPWPTSAQVGTQPASSGQVIAQGIDQLPGGNLIWRVVSLDAAPGETAEFGQRSLGFTVATENPIIVTSLTTGGNAFLSEGQAHFNKGGSNERRSSVSKQPAEYLKIELVAEDAARPTSSDESASILFDGEPFRSPHGDHNLQLTRSVATPAEEATFTPEGDQPFLLFVTAGAVEVTSSGNETSELRSGTYTEFTGEITILSGAQRGATWLIASIGSEVKVPPIPTPSVESGTLEIQLELCPNGFDEDCEPTTSANVTVPGFHTIDNGKSITPDQAKVSNDKTTYTYANLPAGRYTTGPEKDSLVDVNLDGARWSDESEGWEFRIRADRTTTLRLQVVPQGDTGSFLVTIYDCPEGTDPETDKTGCVPTTDPWNLWIAPAGAASLDQFLDLFNNADDLGDGQFLFQNVPATTMDFSPDPDGPDGPVQVYIEGDPYKIDVPGLWAVDIEPGETAETIVYRMISGQTTGSLFVTLYDCPDGTNPLQDTSGCDITSDPWDVTVSNIGQNSREDWTLYNDAIDMGDGTWWFELLPAMGLEFFPDGLNPTGESVVYAIGDVDSPTSNSWVTIPGGGAAEVSLYRVYSDDSVTGATGSLVITQFDCPWGTDIGFDSSPCELSSIPWEVVVTSYDTGVSWYLLTDGNQWDSGTWYFEALPAGFYSMNVLSNGNWTLSYPSEIEVTADDETYISVYSVDLREPGVGRLQE